MERKELMECIPVEILEKIGNKRVIEAGFGSGPSCVAGKIEQYRSPVVLAVALAWIEKYRHAFRKAHVMLDNRTELFFDPAGFIRYDDMPQTSAPRPGVEVIVGNKFRGQFT